MQVFKQEEPPICCGKKAEPTCYTGEAIDGVRDIIDAPDFIVAGGCRKHEWDKGWFVAQTITMREWQ